MTQTLRNIAIVGFAQMPTVARDERPQTLRTATEEGEPRREAQQGERVRGRGVRGRWARRGGR